MVGMLASSGVCDIKYCFKTVSSELHDYFQEGWYTGKIRQGGSRRTMLPSDDLESLVYMDHEVQIRMSRTTQEVERDAEMGVY